MCSEESSVSTVLISQAAVSQESTVRDLRDCSTCTATSRITYLGWGFLFLYVVLEFFPLALVMIYTEYFRGGD